MRVYVAATTSQLRELVETGTISAELVGFAATEALAAEFKDSSTDEVEYALSVAAAEASAALLGAGPAAPSGRRVVVVADLPESAVRPDPSTPGGVQVAEGLELRHVDAVLADPVDISSPADLTNDLAWYATQEISDLLA